MDTTGCLGTASMAALELIQACVDSSEGDEYLTFSLDVSGFSGLSNISVSASSLDTLSFSSFDYTYTPTRCRLIDQ